MSDAVRSKAAPDDLVELGRITAAYGVKGWVKVQPHSAQADVLRTQSQWWLTRPAPQAARGVVASVPVAIKVLQARVHSGTVVAQLDGVADRDQAEALRGHVVSVARSAFPAAGDDEYYWVDLIGCALYTDAPGTRTLIGVVDGVFDNGAHAILQVHRQRQAAADAPVEPMLDAKGRPAEVLVPFVRAHIHGVDLTARVIDSDWPLEED